MSIKGKGGRPKLPEREGDPSKMRTLVLYDSQWQWLMDQPGGAAEWVRSTVDKAMRRAK